MGRIHGDLVDRTKRFAHRVLDVAEELDKSRKWRLRGRVVDQVVGAGTSVGANVREADNALSAKDFVKALAISMKELNESRYWLELVGERGWVKATRLTALLVEAEELSKILHVMIARTRVRLAKV